MIDRGHEVAGHGYANDIYPDEDYPEGELRDIRATVKAIEAATGQKPVGWVSPGSVGTFKTLEYMVQEGFLWNGDDASDDLPFVRRINGKPLVILPRINFPTNDLIVWNRPQNPPSAYFNGFQETFEFMYDEGRRGRPMWIDLLLHSDMGARPGLIGVFEKALRYAKGQERVWFARRRDIAQWALDKNYE
jgi:peptidoglycan/xylan/chitin deacetylase (PgdA/CDA1 family)